MALVAVATSASAEPPPQKRPRRIVSLNLCTDQLLLQLVDRDRIVGVTHLATDADLSVQARKAAGVPAVRAEAEEVLLLRPDLALAGTYGAREAVEVLQREGVRVLQLPPASDWAQVRSQLLEVGAAVGEEGRASALAAELDRKLAEVAARRPERKVRGVYLQHDGTTLGRDTFVDAVFQAAGVENLPATAGLTGYGTLDLERLLWARPELVIVPSYRADVPTLGQQQMRHPALRSRTFAVLELPSAPLFCGTTESVGVLEKLLDWRKEPRPGVSR
jgi:iron complex transport system substrate-binding protein